MNEQLASENNARADKTEKIRENLPDPGSSAFYLTTGAMVAPTFRNRDRVYAIISS